MLAKQVFCKEQHLLHLKRETHRERRQVGRNRSLCVSFDVVFILNIINGNVDCPDLLGSIFLMYPRVLRDTIHPATVLLERTN